MKRKGVLLSAFLLVTLAFSGFSQDGAVLYKTHCGACHSIGGGRLVGPDLAGITATRDKVWLEKFIRNSASMISSGDPHAVAIGKEYNNMLMPPFAGSDGDLAAILRFLEGTAGTSVKAEPDTLLKAVTAEHAARGKSLFSGSLAFENGGAACIACHHVHNAPIPGGTLSKRLNLTFRTMQGAGIRALLQAPPFPAMTHAYGNQPLSEQEIYDLTAYLKAVSQEQISGKAEQAGFPFFLTGLGGTLLLTALYAGFWRMRKRGSVNREIFARQLASEQ